ncbi:MAG TPA: DUF1553 domain-containing protein, partial [Armatimonadota bacterium]|nr:DUF1553 domain-containing protein [Armatimonadota bacterium]
DPITHQDYYRFYALFNQTEDANRGDESPTAPMPTEPQERRVAALDAKLKTLREAFARPVPGAEAEEAKWEHELAGRSLWAPLGFETATSAAGAAFSRRDDGAVRVSGAHAEKDVYTLTLPLPATPVRSVRLEALKDESLPNGGPGRQPSDQNVVTSELEVELAPAGGGARTRLPLVNPRADFEQSGWPVKAAIDGDPNTGWAFAPQNGQPHVAVFDFQAPVTAPGGKLIVTLRQNYPFLQHGCFRISVSGAEPQLLKPELRSLSEIAALPREQRSAADRKRLEDGFRQTHEPTASVYKELAAVEKERAAAEAEVPRIPIMRDLPAGKQRVTRIHQRGNFLDPGETVTPAVPAAFGALPAGAPANRLGAAQWLVSRDNPLTARVAVNRLWARLFGEGLVESEEDFGTQGTLPTHPELLDWLAVEFMEGGASKTAADHPWSTRHILKLIVMSATYRQSSALTADRLKRDPRNLLLSRGPRFRLPAEVLRDQALAVSGLLSAKMYGPSVMPPQPDGLWKTVYSGLKWQTSPGDDRYRRALYTFWRRSSPYPSLTTFDAGSGEFCVIKRVRTNTPLQALVTLNDPAFVEAAGALGRAVLLQPLPGTPERVAWAFHRVLCREPSAAEKARISRLYETTLADLRARPGAAESLLKAANTPAAEGRDPVEQAAWTVVANVMLNLDEALSKP